MKKIFSLFAALTLSAGLWAIDEDAPENFSAEVLGTSYGSITIKAYAEDDSGEIIYTVKESGAVIATANGISGVEKTFTVTGLASGTDYRLLVLAADPTGNETEGLSLRATTLATPEAPEAPIYADQDVISIFSDSYSAATSFNVGSWGQSTVSEEVRLADNTKAYFLSNADYLGWELATTIDVTNMKYVRFDVYPLDGAGTAIEFTPNWGGEKLLKQEGLVAGAWNTVTFSIEDFSGIVKDNINQLIWSNMPTEMFITNVLFYTDGAEVPAPYLFVDGIVTINELKDGETIYFQYFTYVDGKRVNGIAGDTNRNKSFKPYTTEGYCEISYTNMDDVERKYITNPVIVGNVDSIFQGEVYLFVDTLLTTAGTYNRMIGDSTATLTLSVKQNAPVVGDKFVDETSGLKFEVTAVGEANTVMVIVNNYTDTTYTIPATVKYNDVDFAVTEIGENAFFGWSSLQSITLSEGLITIGEMAFSMTGLTSITIPASVTEIGIYAFYASSALTSVTFLGNACQNAIGELAFLSVGDPDPALLTLPNSWTGTLPDEDGNWYGGKFELSEDPTALPTLFGANVDANKFLHNGQLIIERNGVKYTATGQKVK